MMNENLKHQQLLPGLKPVLEILSETPEKVDLVMYRANLKTKEVDIIEELCKKNMIQCKKVEKDILDKLCNRQGLHGGITAHQGIVARLTSFSFAELDAVLDTIPDAPLPLLIALDEVQDPGNIGTLVRTLYALGGAGILVPNQRSAHLGPAAHKTAAGALEKLPIVRVDHLGRALDSCEERGLYIIGTDGSKNAKNAFQTPIQFPCVLVLGNEENGLRNDIKKRCHTILRIPQFRDFNSINVAQAGAILIGLASYYRQKL